MSVRTGRILLIAGGVVLILALLLMRPGAIERRLGEGAREALDAAGHEWARVEMNGQVATVSGIAPDEALRNDALARVRGSVWAGGVVAGGITRVIDRTETPRQARGFAFRADLLNGRARLRGDAPDSASRDRLASFARNRFTAGAEADLTLAPGGAPSGDWAPAAERLLGQLARLQGGAAVLAGPNAALVGEASNPAVAQSAAQALTSLPEPFRASVLLRPSGAPAVIRIEDAAGCGAVIEALRGPNPFRFDLDGADPSPAASGVLAGIGEAFAACPSDLALEVSLRVEEGGEDLASQRAGRVVDLLAANAPAARLTPVLAGQQDRRVEFNIMVIAPAAPTEAE
jgi:hypothetical protein